MQIWTYMQMLMIQWPSLKNIQNRYIVIIKTALTQDKITCLDFVVEQNPVNYHTHTQSDIEVYMFHSGCVIRVCSVMNIPYLTGPPQRTGFLGSPGPPISLWACSVQSPGLCIELSTGGCPGVWLSARHTDLWVPSCRCTWCCCLFKDRIEYYK